MRYEPFLVEIRYQNNSFKDFGRDNENPMKTAKRILFERANVKADRVVFLEYGPNIDVSTISEEISRFWPKGAKIIPHYIFAY